MRDLTVGIDIGTTSVKAIVVSGNGEIIYKKSLSNNLFSPKPGFAEEDANVWWENTKKLLTNISLAIDKKRICGIGFSGMVPTLILVGAEGNPLYNSIQQNDARAVVEINEFKKEIDEDSYFHLTGNTINQQSIFPKYRWLSKHKGDIVKKTCFIMGSYNFCTYRLTDVPNLESNWALESGMWLLREKKWHEEVLKKSNINKSLLPHVFDSLEIVGKVIKNIEKETGFPSGIPVIAGSADHVASALAAGVQDEGDLLLKLGGAGDILFATDSIKIDKRLFIDYHSMKDRYLLNGCMASSGSIVKWFVNEFNLQGFDKLTEKAEKISPGSDGLLLLPYFIGEKTPIFDVNAKGVFFGLSLYHTKYHLFRAILEAVAYGFMHHLDVMKEMGLKVNNVYISNGGAKSVLWKKILVDVIGHSGIYIPNHPGSSLGVAFLAAQAVGISKNWDGLKNFLKNGTEILYLKDNHERYQKYFEFYKKLYLHNKPLFEELKLIEEKKEG